MKNPESILIDSPVPIFACLALLLLLGLFNLLSGVLYRFRETDEAKQPLERMLVWGAAVAVSISLFVLAWAGFDIKSTASESAVIWKLGWILPRREPGAIALGARADAMSVVACGLTALTSLLVVLFLAIEKRGRVALLLVSSALFGQVAACLAWLSVGPWLSFPALMLALFSGCIGLGLRWRSEFSAGEVSRFAIERACGLLLAVSGVAVLPSKGVGNPALSVSSWAGTAMQGQDSWAGMVLFVLGVGIFIQPFPLLGRLTRPSEGEPIGRLFLGAALPSWAALGVLVRNFGLFEATELPSLMGWGALVFGLLAAVTGVFQRRWSSSAALLISSLYLAAVAALGFGGTLEALTLGVGPLVAGLGFSILGASLIETGEVDASARKNKSEAKPSRGSLLWGIVFAWGISGGLGFVGAGGWLSVISEAVQSSTLLVGVGLALFAACSVLAAQAVTLVLAASSVPSQEGPPSRVFMLAACILAVLGLMWTGRLSGLGSNAFNDSLFAGLLAPIAEPSGRADAGVQAVLSGVALLSFTLAFWGGGVFRKWIDSLISRAPGFSQFVSSGYAMDRLFGWLIERLRAAGVATQKHMDEKLLGSTIPDALGSVISLIGVRAGRSDITLTDSISKLSRVGLVWFSAGVQAVQTGSLQWYVAVGIGSGVALLIHFLVGRS